MANVNSSKPALSRVSRLNLKLYTGYDYGEMIRKEELNAVIMDLPNHKGCSTLTTEQGRDILIENVLATNTRSQGDRY